MHFVVICIFFVAMSRAQETARLNASDARREASPDPQAVNGSGDVGSGAGKEEEIELTKKGRPKCRYAGPHVSILRSRAQELACCEEAIEDFEWEWFRGGFFLQTFFEKLKLWRCPQFKKVCEENLYARFSDYSKLVYLYHCNAAKFQLECKPAVSSARGMPSNTSWDDVINEMTSSEFSTEILTEPCVQVAMYGSKSGGYGYYHEIIDVFTPFCDISWCGFDTKTIEERGISSWNCISSMCRVNLIVSSVVCGILALAIVFANITVIVVFTTSPKLRNSQAVYKISLAIADLLVGVFVIPTFISSLMILYHSKASVGDVMKNAPANSEGTLPRKSGGRFSQRFPVEYLDFVGFFTILSLVVSIYTLMMASGDRFMAIYQPLRYGRHNAKRLAIWASLILWVVGILFSAMPYFIPEMGYGLVASIMVASHGMSAMFLYAIAVVLPLLFVWITTIATFLSTKRHARRRQKLTVRRSNSGNGNVSNMETRLARTLASMVGVFTLCLLPTALVLIVPFFLTSVYHHYPDLFSATANKTFISMEFVAIVILMTNSLWNCFIYNARSEDFKTTAKRMYKRLLRRMGFNIIWKKTRNWASSTMRSRRSTLTTSAGPSSMKKLQKKPSQQTLRTMSSDPNNGSHPKSPLSNGKGFPAFLPSGNGQLKEEEKEGVVNPGYSPDDVCKSEPQTQLNDANTKPDGDINHESHKTDAV